MPELTVVIPFCNEHPQHLFTIQNIAQELIGRADFEIVAVDNYVKQEVNRPDDGGGNAVEACAGHNKWLKFIRYTDKLSHWNAKRVAVESTDSKFLFFCDAHCIIARDALHKMFQLYRYSYKGLEGSIHLPLTYKILEWRKLIYALQCDLSIGKLHYTFCSYRNPKKGLPYEVPVMSTCGMMITRDIYEDIGGWPPELGIYGGGENFINFTMAVLGYKKWIMPGEPLFHHGDKRGYAWNYGDMLRNKVIATYIAGGKAMARTLLSNCKGRPKVLDMMYNDVLQNCLEHRQLIKGKQKVEIEQWLETWDARWQDSSSFT